MHRRSRLLVRLSFVVMVALGLLMSLGGAEAGSGTVRVLSMNGTITPAMATYIDRGITEANHDDAVTAIVIRMDTPGGLSTAMDDIIDDILQSGKPVIVYVSPANARAASAGVYITYAAHVAAMAPGTNIGSASPVNGDGSDLDSTMKAKVTNDAVARIVNLAHQRGRNATWAEQAVREAVNITADDALKQHVIDVISPDLPSLLQTVNGRTVTVAGNRSVTLDTADASIREAPMNAFERLLQLISDPTIAYMLMSLGSLGIFMELAHPGGWVPGVLGVSAMILALYALGSLPVDWTGVALIALAFGLFFLEIFVTSFGILTVGGLAAFIAGSAMLIKPGTPGYDRIATPVIGTITLLFAGSAIAICWLVVKTQRRRPTTGKQSLVGMVAEVRTRLAPSGIVFVDGEYWQAHTDGSAAVEAGSLVEVVSVNGLRLFVRPAPAAQRHRATDVPRGETLVSPSRV